MTVFVPLARSRALTRALLWVAAAVVCAGIAWLILMQVDWRPSPVSGRLVAYAMGLLAMPFAVAALVMGLVSIRWLLLAVWPGRVGVEADTSSLVVHGGPFGERAYDVARLETRYPFELSEDDEGGRFGEFEMYLPEEVQRRTLLPQMSHVDSGRPLDLVVLKYLGRPEAEIAAALRPVLDQWRSLRAASGHEGQD